MENNTGWPLYILWRTARKYSTLIGKMQTQPTHLEQIICEITHTN